VLAVVLSGEVRSSVRLVLRWLKSWKGACKSKKQRKHQVIAEVVDVQYAAALEDAGQLEQQERERQVHVASDVASKVR
jgi:hypothetical protein